MKKGTLIIIALLLLTMNTFSENKRNTYEAEWKKVEQYQTDALPQSAIQEIQKILEIALKEKNVPQIIKSYIYLDRFEQNIDKDFVSLSIPALENLLLEVQSPIEKAFLHTVLANIYCDTYNNDRWNINQRTNLSNDIPEDIKEWTSNIFQDKIAEHLEATLANKDALKKSTSVEYDDIISLGIDSRAYYPTLYDFMMERTIRIANLLSHISKQAFDLKEETGYSAVELAKPAKDYISLNIKTSKNNLVFKYYQEYLSDLLQRNMTGTIILTELDKLKNITSHSGSFDNKQKLDALYSYETAYASNETSVEIINEIVLQLQATKHIWRYNPTENSKEKSTEINDKIYSWLQKGINKYPHYKRINILQSRLTEFEKPELEVEGKNIFYNDEEIILDITHKNNQLLSSDKDKILNLYKIKNVEKEDDEEEVFVKTYPTNYKSEKTYESEKEKLNIGKLPFGKYILRNDADEFNDGFEFSVSNIFTFYRTAAEGIYDIFVVDRKNGKPIKGAKINVYDSDWDDEKYPEDLIKTLTTDDNGFVRFDGGDENLYSISYSISHDKDKYLIHQDIDGWYYDYDENNEQEYYTSIFTDRSIYRPGQTVFFKAIVLNKKAKTINKKEQAVKLFNNRGQLISEKVLYTNEYGSIADSFVLPKSGMLGSYRIEVGERSNSVYFNVEEYKRPTFEVKFEQIEQSFSFGDKVVLKGTAKTFSGISLQNTDVKYNITRQVFSFWHRNSGNHYQDGIVKTKDDGSFEIEFTLEPGDERSLFGRRLYTFNINAEITDLNGETQTGEYSVSAGDVSMMLNIELPQLIEKTENTDIQITAKNLQGFDVQSKGSYEIYGLDKNDSLQSKILDGKFETGKQTELANKLKDISSGKYRIKILAYDDKNREVEAQSDFAVYSYDDKRPPYEIDVWLVDKVSTFSENKAAEIIYGTSRKDTYILYQLFDGKETLERKFVKFNDENKTFKIPYKAEYGDQLYATFTTIINEQNATTNSILLKKDKTESNKELKVKASVFRDKLRPGEKETWTLVIGDKENKPIEAEVLASMYDLSLDKIRPYQKWYYNNPVYHTKYIRNLYYQTSNIRNIQYYPTLQNKNDLLKEVPFLFDRLIINAPPHYYDLFMGNGMLDETVVVAYGSASKIAVRGISSALSGQAAGIAASPTPVQEATLDESMAVEEEKRVSDNQPQLRQNFNETVFFYPQLRTNEKGETLVSFIVPESNTTWRFRTFAHDREGAMGELEKTVVTRKELMVTPNMPRFVRHGDKTSISTKISNLSENAISGKVSIQFFDPISEKVIELQVDNKEQTFDLAKDASSSASWTFDIPSHIDMLGVRIVAESESFSDGEQHALAVLPNRMLITETMPMDVTRKGEESFVMNKLLNNKSNSIDNYKLTFEFTSNPVWYAVQALPTMSNPSNENSINWFTSYYVNTLGSSLMKQYPKVAKVIQSWKAEGGDKETLISKMDKNDELKTILLEETPWVMAANNETEQMERLSLLFDLNNTQQLTSTAIQKLKELQMQNGAWSWYKGLYPSRGITQYLLFGFANLQRIGMVEYSEQIKTMQINALKYVDEQIVKDFENLKKYNKNWKDIKSISTSQLEYLYVRSMYRDIPINQETREAERFYTDVVSQNWQKLSLYQKSLLAVLSKELGETELANRIVKSIREYAVVDKEMGMYWPNNKTNVFTTMSAVCSHIFVMEALIANGATQEEISLMKRWLIKQKQTQVWENTNATIHAISVLLQEGEDWFTSNSEPVIKVGKETLSIENKELGTGYFKTAWTASEIDNKMGKISITSDNDRPAYGALYWQYYEDLDKITKQDGLLNISKELYRETADKGDKTLERITTEKPIKVGDKVIIRLVIRSDRDLEFVQVKDMRAACFEPLQTISGIGYQNSLPYYQMSRDASTNFFFDTLPKGTYVLEYAVYTNRTGEYANGISSIQCAYAPEFTAHTAGIKVIIE